MTIAKTVTNCKVSKYINQLKMSMNEAVPAGAILFGILSEFKNK